MTTRNVSQSHKTGWLIQGHPIAHFMGERIHNNFCVFRKVIHHFGAHPAAFLMHPQWQIPMIKGANRLDTVCRQFVDQIHIELKTLFADFPRLRHHPGPTDRKTVGLQSKNLHQRHIFLISVVVVA